MGRMRQILSRARVLIHLTKFDDELCEEMRLHIEMITEENIRAGMSERQARRDAMMRFGNRTIMEETSREVWIHRAFETVIQDIRYGLRMIARTPGFTIVAVLSLALGIGANTAIFTVMDSLMLKMLPVKDPRRLVTLEIADYKIGDFTLSSFSYPAYASLRDNNEVFDGLLASGGGGTPQFVMNGPGASGQVETATMRLVSGNYFSTLTVRPIIGRTITEDDDKVGAALPVVVIGYDYWKSRFGLDPSVVGRTFAVTDTSFTIIGVAPPGFFGTQVGETPDMFAPLAIQPILAHGESMIDRLSSHWLSLMARLKPGISIQQADANSNVAYRRVVDQEASSIKDAKSREQVIQQHLRVSPGGRGQTSWIRDSLSTQLLILMGIVGIVLLIACANIANLMLARGSARRKEISVRLALGAGRSRLVRQLLTESLILALLGGAFGLFLAFLGSGFLVRLVSTGSLPVLLDLHPDLGTLGFTAGICVLTGLLFGLAPALRATRVDLAPALKERASYSAISRHGLGKALVAGQVALSLLLLVGAGLFARTYQKLRGLDLGFDQAHLYQVFWDAWSSGYKNEKLAVLFDEATERVSSLPGVLSVSLSETGLFSRSISLGWVTVEGNTSAEPDEEARCRSDRVGRSFFETVGMTIARGRSFGPEDSARSPKVAVINESLAQHYFGGADPIGKRIYYRDPERKDPIEVVGIVKDAKYLDLRGPTPPMLYTPYVQGENKDKDDLRGINLIEVKAIGEPASLASAIRNQIYSLDRNLAVESIDPLGGLVNDSLVQERAIATISSFFSLLALMLAGIGLYGIMSYSVNQRTAEIGIRLALGARPGKVEWLVLKETLLLLAIGIGTGLAAAVASTRLISSFLFGLSPVDPLAIIVATMVMAAVSVLAGYLPARRASRVDPMVALRYE
jgi:predicted permease